MKKQDTKVNLLVSERVLDKIRTLRSLTNWHESVMPLFDMWEKQIESLELDDEFYGLPKVKELATMAHDRIKKAEDELKTNRTLNDFQRTYLFAIKDMAELELSVFSPQSMLQTAQSIEAEVDAEREHFWADQLSRNEIGG